MKLTQERIEEVLNTTHSWEDEKVERLSERLLDLCEHAIKTNTPNLVNEVDAHDMHLLIDAFRIQLEQQKFDGLNMEEVVFDEVGAPESDVTSEDKDALLEFADKLKNKAEHMEVTAVKDPVTQEEAPLSSQPSSDTLKDTSKDPQATPSTSKKGNGKSSSKPKKEDK
jgi:hypothetical protein